MRMEGLNGSIYICMNSQVTHSYNYYSDHALIYSCHITSQLGVLLTLMHSSIYTCSLRPYAWTFVPQLCTSVYNLAIACFSTLFSVIY